MQYVCLNHYVFSNICENNIIFIEILKNFALFSSIKDTNINFNVLYKILKHSLFDDTTNQAFNQNTDIKIFPKNVKI